MTDSQRPITIRKNETVREAAWKMIDFNVGVLVIVDDEGHYAGTVTDRAMARKVTNPKFSIELDVWAIRTPALSGSPDQTVADLRTRVEIEGTHFFTLICDADNKPTRIISYADALKAENAFLSSGSYDRHTGQRLPEKAR